MTARIAKRRGLVVVASDFLEDPATWERPLRRLATRHDALAVEVVDPRELSLPAVGLLTLVDPETGGLLEVQTSNPSCGPATTPPRPSSGRQSPGRSDGAVPSTCSCAPTATGSSTSCASSGPVAAGAWARCTRRVTVASRRRHHEVPRR